MEKDASTEGISFADDINKALAVLKNGGIILYPTDTVWGIGCDASCSEAVRRIFDLKHRADSKSMLSLVDSEAMLDRTVRDIPEVAWQLIEAAVDPLTIVYDHPVGLAPELLAPDGSAGIRITSGRVARELCRRLRRPIVSTSANISGEKAATDFASISKEITDGVDYAIAHDRECGADARPSAVIKLGDGGLVKILR